MPQISAGLLMTRVHRGQREFFLVHPGGPFFKNRDAGAWSIPKGLADANEELLTCAIREFAEETGLVPNGPYIPLDTTRMKSGKTIHAWMFEGEWDERSGIVSNHFLLEWPPRSGRKISVPEADRATWAELDRARKLIHPSQLPFLDRAAAIPVTPA